MIFALLISLDDQQQISWFCDEFKAYYFAIAFSFKVNP